MRLEERNRRQSELNMLIYELALEVVGAKGIRQMTLKMNDIYGDDYKHNYSDFFPILTDVLHNENYSIEILSENLEQIRIYIEKDYVEGVKEFTNLHSKFVKLFDHLNLQIAQLLYIEAPSGKKESLEEGLKQAKKDLESSIRDLEEVRKEIERVKVEIVTVLGIFAAIVIAFSGGLSFLGSALSSVQEVRIFKSVFICALCGIVLFNIIFVLMYFISRIVNKSIYATCKTIDCTCDKKCRTLNIVRKRLPYVFYFNLFMVLVLLGDAIIWYFINRA